jgi:DNA-binding LytR/AlgR family response regulator
MKILLVEDEPIAAKQLLTLVKKLRPNWQITAICDTIKSTVAQVNEEGLPDLAFFDIQLGDGLSFEIFKLMNFNAPVIFTTAFDEYAIQAFKVNSIDYLLKPVLQEDLEKALQKFEQQQKLYTHHISTDLIQLLQQSLYEKKFKKRFLVKLGNRLKSIETENIAYFYSFDKATYAKTIDGKDYLLDHTLESIEQQIDPAWFFRINRKYLVKLTSIVEVFNYSNSRLKLKISNSRENDFLVSREKVKAFKTWFEGEH